jgi:hypothetical protein
MKIYRPARSHLHKTAFEVEERLLLPFVKTIFLSLHHKFVFSGCMLEQFVRQGDIKYGHVCLVARSQYMWVR